MVDQKRGNIAVLSPLQGCDLGSNQPGEAPCQKTHRSRPITAETTALLDPPRLPVMPLQKLGCLATRITRDSRRSVERWRTEARISDDPVIARPRGLGLIAIDPSQARERSILSR